MRSRVSLVLVAAAALVIAICELESAAELNRWDPSDLGRTANLSWYLLPDPPPADQHALITVRIEAGGDVRIYRYWIAPEEDQPLDVSTREEIEADAKAAGMGPDRIRDLVAAAQ